MSTPTIQLLFPAASLVRERLRNLARPRLIPASLALTLFLTAVEAPERALGQGCVSSPGNPVSPLLESGMSGNAATSRGLLGSLSYRFYESGRHYVGDEEQTQRERLGNNVINDVHTFDVAATYGFSPRWSVTLDIPFMLAARSSLYEHDFVNRHTMHSGGLGDLRLVTDYWLLDPHQHMDGNIALGIGFKAPTGDDQEADIAYRSEADGGPTLRPVDPSVQPGDGGWGIILELQAYRKIARNLYGYLQGSYTMTPEEQNNTQFTLADIPRFAALLTPLRTYNSIPDQYFGRGGLSYTIWPSKGVVFSLGGRIEGVPAYDAIGGSMGFRRPGYTVSVEPGISWSGKRNSFSLNTPVAVYRNRVRSAPETALGLPTGDAAFADFSILASFTHRF